MLKSLIANHSNIKPKITATLATHLGEICKALDTYSKKYENTLLMGNFNVEPTCFENVNKSFCIHVFLTNSSKCLENSLTLGRGLPNLHKTTVTVMKTKYERSLRIVKQRP